MGQTQSEVWRGRICSLRVESVILIVILNLLNDRGGGEHDCQRRHWPKRFRDKPAVFFRNEWKIARAVSIPADGGKHYGLSARLGEK
jgi:hypothetical protein